MLGITDLHTPEAVGAAEAAIAGYQPAITLPASSSETGTEDYSDDSEDNDDEDSETDDGNEDDKTLFPMNLKRSKTTKNNSSSESTEKKQ